MANVITIFKITDAWVEVLDSYSRISTEDKTVTFIVTARVHHRTNDARKKASKLLRDHGWIKNASMSDDFYKKSVIKDELKIEVDDTE